jgi:hypothetical protein
MKWLWKILNVLLVVFLSGGTMYWWMNLRLNDVIDTFDKQILELNQKLINTQNQLT